MSRQSDYVSMDETSFRINVCRDLDHLYDQRTEDMLRILEMREEDQERMDGFEAKMAKLLGIGLGILVSLTTAAVVLAMQIGVGK